MVLPNRAPFAPISNNSCPFTSMTINLSFSLLGNYILFYINSSYFACE